MTENDLLEHILDRLARSNATEEVFTSDETETWPAGALESLLENGLLRPTKYAKSVFCNGCEENCPMPVEILAHQGQEPARAFIFCDKPINLGRIVVGFDRLRQWEITTGLLTRKISKLLQFNKTPQNEAKSNRWILGLLRGKKQSKQVFLSFEKEILLQLSGHQIPLIEIMWLSEGQLILDKKYILQLLNKPSLEKNTSNKMVNFTHELNKQETSKMYIVWQKEYRDLKRRRPDLTDVACSKQISKMEIAKGRDSETIRKKMKR